MTSFYKKVNNGVMKLLIKMLKRTCYEETIGFQMLLRRKKKHLNKKLIDCHCYRRFALKYGEEFELELKIMLQLDDYATMLK